MAINTEDRELWEKTLNDLKLQMTQATFQTWLQGTHVVARENNHWTIGVKHAYGVDWLAHRLAPTISRALARYAGGQGLGITFVVAPTSPAEAQARNDQAEIAAEMAKEPILEAVRERKTSITAEGQTLQWEDFYIKLKVAFRRVALAKLKGVKLSVFMCLALHVDQAGFAKPGIELVMRETGYSRAAVCSGLDDLEHLGLIKKYPQQRGPDQYAVIGYAWFGSQPAPALWEID